MESDTPYRGRERRRYPRSAVSLEGTLRAAGVASPCRIHNISAGGALVEADAGLRIGEIVTLKIHDLGEMIGRVVRVSSTTMAIAFVEAEATDDTYVGEWCPIDSRGAPAEVEFETGKIRRAV